MPELLLRQAPAPLMTCWFNTSLLSGKPTRLEITSTSTFVLRTLLSFEGLGARASAFGLPVLLQARVDLENSIATSIPVFF